MSPSWSLKGFFGNPSRDDNSALDETSADPDVDPQQHTIEAGMLQADVIDTSPPPQSSKRGGDPETTLQSEREAKRARRNNDDNDRHDNTRSFRYETDEIDSKATRVPSNLRRENPLSSLARQQSAHGTQIQGHRPRNTLDGPPTAGVPKNRSVPTARGHYNNSQRLDGTANYKHQLHHERQRDVANGRGTQIEGVKRRRLDNERLPDVSLGRPIDLTGDDDDVRQHQQATDTRLSGQRPTSKGSLQSDPRSPSSEKSPYFSNQEFEATRAYTETGQFAKPSSTRKYSSNSRATSTIPTTPRTNAHRNLKLGNSILGHRSSSPVWEPPEESYTSSPKQPLQFSNGISTFPKASTEEDVILLEKPVQRQIKVFRSSPSAKFAAFHEQKRDVNQSYAKRCKSEDHDFQRIDDEDGTQTVRKTKARDRMQPSSRERAGNLSSVRVSIGSEDELSCSPTIPRTSISSTSGTGPAHRLYENTKKSRVAMQSSALHETGMQDDESKPELVETIKSKYSGSEKATSSGCSRFIHIPVKSVYSQFCVAEQDGLELVWVKDDQVFLVAENGEVRTIPGRTKFFKIDKRAVVHAWNQCKNSLIVQLKGSQTEFGSGQVLIQFKDQGGLSMSFTLLSVAASTTLPFFECGCGIPCLLRKKFEKQAQELQKSFSMERTKASAKMRDISLPDSKSPSRISGAPVDEEPVRVKLSNISVTSPTQEDRELSERTKSPFAETTFSENDDNHLTRDLNDNRRSSRLSRRPVREDTPLPPEKWTQIHKPEPWSQPLVYPATSTPRVTVNFSDLERLDEGEFINDSLVSFALRRIQEGMADRYKRDVHFFNSFFFTALSSKNGRTALNYDAVKRWTRSKDLFATPYVVVPINMDLHWFVAIICNLPNLQRRLSDLDDQPDEVSEVRNNEETRTASAEAVLDVAPGVQSTTVDMPASSLEQLQHPAAPDNSDFDQSNVARTDGATTVEDIDGHFKAVSPASPAKSKKKKFLGKKYDVNEPVIISLDSLGNTHSTEIRYLKEYIKAEASDKRAMDVEINQLVGITAKGIPLQLNFCDCGLYLIGYIEEFAKDPQKFVSKILRREMEETDFGDFDPSAMRSRLRDDLLELVQKQEADRKAHKAAKRAAKRQAGVELQTRVEADVPTSSKGLATVTPPIAASSSSPQPGNSNVGEGKLEPSASFAMADSNYKDASPTQPLFQRDVVDDEDIVAKPTPERAVRSPWSESEELAAQLEPTSIPAQTSDNQRCDKDAQHKSIEVDHETPEVPDSQEIILQSTVEYS